MNLDELQIKISIELDDLNKQLKTVTKGIDKALGPKATKKLMADNNKIIKSGLTSINKTTLNLVKKSRKDTTKEIEAMSKDITKTLNKAFDVSFTKLNSNITSAMNQAKMTVRSACNDIRRELNAALNIKGNIRVTSKTSITGSATGSSGSNAASSISSGQYIGAMIIKATNAVIANNNANTTRLEHAIDNLGNKLTSAIKGMNINTNNDDVVKAINNLGKALGKKGGYKVKRHQKNDVVEQEENLPAVIPQEVKAKPKKKIQMGTKSNGRPTNYSRVDSGIFFTLEQLNHKVNFILGEVTDTGAFLKALQEALKQSVKATNIYNRFMDDISKSINIKRLGTGSYGKNPLVGGTVNWTRGEDTKEYHTGRVVDDREQKQQGLGYKEIYVPYEYKVIDDELKEIVDKTVEKINNSVPRIEITPEILEGNKAVSENLARIRQELENLETVKPTIFNDMARANSLEDVRNTLGDIRRELGILDNIDGDLDFFDFGNDLTFVDALEALKVHAKEVRAELEWLVDLFQHLNKIARPAIPESARSLIMGTYDANTGRPQTPASVEAIEVEWREVNPEEKPQIPESAIIDVEWKDVDNVEEDITKVNKTLTETKKLISDLSKITPDLNAENGMEDYHRKQMNTILDANAKEVGAFTSKTDLSKLKDMMAQLQKMSEELEFDLAELFHDVDAQYLEESLLSVRDVIKNFMPRLKEVVETLNGLDAERIKLNIDTTDAQKQIEALKASYEMLIEQCKAAYKANNANILRDIIPQIGGPVDSGNKRKYPSKPIGGFGGGSGDGTSNKGGRPPKPHIDRASYPSSSEGDRPPRTKTPDPKDYSAFISDVEKLSSRLDIAADDLMEVIKLLDDASDVFNDLDNADGEALLKGFENLDGVEEILSKLSKADLSHLNRDIKNLAQTISSDDEFETSAIKKLQDRLTALSQVRSKLSKIRTNASKGGGIDSEALKTQFRAVQDYKNASFGEGSPGSLGFSAYRRELNKLSKLAGIVGAKIRKALKIAFNPTEGPAKLNLALTRMESKAVSIFNNIKNKAKAAFSKVATPLANSLSKVTTPVKNTANKIVTPIKNAMSRATEATKNYGIVIKAHLNKAFTGIKSSKLYTSIASGLNKAKSAVSKFSSKTKSQLNKAVDGNKVGTKFASTIKKGLDKAKGMLSKFANSCKTLWGKIKQIFSKGANDASKATGKLTSGLKGLLSQAFGFFSIYGLINLGREAITQSQTLAQSEIKLTSLMKQRMGATNDTVTAIRQLVEEQSKLGVVSKTALTRGAEQLSMYVHSAKALKDLMPAIANLTAKRGGFMATEDDAEEIATQLGEAIREGTTTPLEQSGIYLSEAEIKKFQALRTEEERAAYLANVIAKNVGNINQALANTPIGAMTQLKNNFKELLGTLGIFLANVLKPIVQWLNVIVVACNNALKALGKLLGFDMTGGALSVGDIGAGGSTEVDTGGIDDAKDSLDDTADSAEDAEKAVEKFKGSLMGFDEINVLSDNTGSDSSDEYDPTDITPGEGGQLIPDVGELTEGEGPFDKFADKMKAFMDEVLEPFKKAWELLGDDLIAEWQDLKESFKNFCDSLGKFLKSVWDNGGKEFVQHLAEIGLACGIAAMEIGGEILDSLARLWDHLDPSKNMNTQGFLDALNETSVKIRDFILGLGDHFESLMANGGQDALNAMGDMFMNFGEAAARGIGVAIDALDDLIDHLDPANNENTKNMLQSLADMFHATGQTALDFVSLLESCLVNGGQDMINAFGDMMMNLGQATSEVITTMMQSFSELFKYLDPATNEITRGMMKSWEEAFGSIGQGLLDFSGFFKSVMENGGQEVLNAFADMLNSLVGLVGDIVDEMAKAASELYKHLDPSKNEYTKGMLKAWEDAFKGITDVCKSFSELLSSTLENGGQEIINSFGDLGANIGKAVGVFVDEIAKAFAELFDHMDPAKNKNSKDMLKSFDKLVDSVNDFVTAITKLFKKFMDAGGREFVKNLGDIVAIVLDLAAAIGSGVIDLVTGFMNSWAGQALIEGAAKALEWFSDKLEGLKAVIEPLKDVFQDVVDFIVGIFEGDGEKVGRAFVSFIKNALKVGFELSKFMAEIGEALILGLIEGIKALPGLLWECVKFIFDFIVGVFKELFGIHSPSTVMADLGVNLIEGLIEGIKNMITSVVDALGGIKDAIFGWFEGILSSASENWNTLCEVTSGKWGEIKESITNFCQGTFDNVSEKWKEIKENVSEKCKEIFDDTKEKWTNIKDNVSETISNLKDDASDKYNELKDTLTDTMDKWRQNSEEKWNKIKDKTSDLVSKLKSDTEDKYNKFKEALTDTMDKWRQNSEEKWNKIKDKADDLVSNLKSNIEDKYSKFRDKLTDTMDSWRQNSEEKWTKIKDKTTELATNLKDTVEDKYTKFKDNLTDTMDKWRSNSEDKWNNIKSKTSELVSNLKSDTETKYNNMKEALNSKIESVRSTSEAAWKNIKDKASEHISNLKSDVESKYETLKTNLTNKLESWRSTSEDKWNNIKEKGVNAIEDIRKNGEEKFESLKTAVTTKMETIKTDLVSKWETVKNKAVEYVNSMKSDVENKYNDLKTKIGAKLEEVKSETISKWENIKSTASTKIKEVVDTAASKFGEMKSSFTSKMDEVKNALTPKWTDLKNSVKTNASGLGDKVTEGLSGLKNKFTKPFEDAKKSISDAISGIGRTISNANWSLPKIKLPHFKISGGFSLNPPSAPKFSVEWYKRGGIIDGITPLGFTGGTMHMAGEAGKEMIVPLENTSFTSKIAQAMGQAVDNAMARNMNSMYGSYANNNNDSKDIVLKVNERELARASINSINKLQRESGRTLLDI